MNAIIIAARLESERLPQKHLKVVEGLPLIKWLTERIKLHFNQQIKEGLKVIIASPQNELNKKFAALFKDDKTITTFSGDEKNIPWRIMQCSDAFALDKVAIADGDNFLLSMQAIKAVLKNLKEGALITKTEGLPLGMNVMGWSAAHLKSTLNSNKFNLLETGWGRIFKSEDTKKIQFDYKHIPQLNLLRFTTDYPEDLKFMQAMFGALKENALTASPDQIINIAIANKFYELNGFLSEIYFDNFYKKMEEEKIINHENT